MKVEVVSYRGLVLFRRREDGNIFVEQGVSCAELAGLLLESVRLAEEHDVADGDALRTYRSLPLSIDRIP